MPEEKDNQSSPEEKPPLFQTWNGWYTLVLVNLVAMILLFYLFMVYFQ